MRPLGVAVEIEPLRQLDLRDQQEDRRGDLVAAGLRARRHRLATGVDACPVGDQQAGPAAAIDETETQAAAPLPFARGELGAAEAAPGGLSRDCEPEAVFRADQRAGV